MADVTVHLARNLVQAEQLGQTERVKRIKERLADAESVPEAPSLSNTKAELLEAAAGLDVDESNTKAEILEALEEE